MHVDIAPHVSVYTSIVIIIIGVVSFHIDQSFITVYILRWSLWGPHVFVLKIVCFWYKYKCIIESWRFHIDLLDFKTLNDCWSKTTCLIKLKLIGSVEQANKSMYINVQVILTSWKKIGIFSFNGHRYLLWFCKHPNKLKEL